MSTLQTRPLGNKLLVVLTLGPLLPLYLSRCLLIEGLASIVTRPTSVYIGHSTARLSFRPQYFSRIHGRAAATMQLLHWTSNRAQVSDLTLTPPQSPRRFFSPSAVSPSTSLVDDTNSSTLSPSPGLPILLPTPLSETAVVNDLDYAAGLLDVEQKLATIKQLQLVHDHAAKLEAQKRRCLQRIAEIETTLPYAWSRTISCLHSWPFFLDVTA